MKMKVVLIYPPHPYLSEETQQPPLGLLYIAETLLRAGYEVYYVELGGILEKDWLLKIPEGNVYGFQVSYLDINICDKIAKELKKTRNGIIIMGGIHPTTLSKSINFSIWDSIVVGEGEIAIINLLRDLKQGKLKSYYSSSFIKDINGIPFPARYLLPQQGGRSFFNKKEVYFPGGSTSIISSRGCPYNCAYCGSKSIWKKKVRFRSPENIYAEIKQVISQYGIRQFRFQDDTITLDKNRLILLCNMLSCEEIAFLCTTRGDVVDDEILSSLVKAGCKEIGFGIESADQNVLNVLKKEISVTQNLKAIKMAKEHGLKVRLFFMMGTPGESEATPHLNIKFVEESSPDLVSLMIFAPFPASDVWNYPAKYGIKILTTDLTQYTITSHPKYLRKPVIAINGLTKEQQEQNILLMRNFLNSRGLINFG